MFPASFQLPAILTEVSRAISAVSRVTKRQGCSGLKDLASTLGPSLGESSSGRRLIRRVLSQVPGRTWEGKEELLEAVTALCAAGKGYAVTLEPFVWGVEDVTGAGGDSGGEGGGPPSSCSSRGVKRSRSSEPLGHEDEEEEDEDEDGEEEEEERGASASLNREGGAGASGAASETAGAKGSEGGDGASDDNDPTDNVDGADGPAFEYEDKLGDIVDAPVPAPAEAALLASVQTSHDSQASGEPRKDTALEAGLASLDMEDDSPIPFGEVVTLMLSQLRR